MSGERSLYMIMAWRGRFFVGSCIADTRDGGIKNTEWIGDGPTLEDARFIVQVGSTGVLPKRLLWQRETQGHDGMIEVWGRKNE